MRISSMSASVTGIIVGERRSISLKLFSRVVRDADCGPCQATGYRVDYVIGTPR